MDLIRFQNDYINMDQVVEAKVKDDRVQLVLTSTDGDGKSRVVTLTGQAAIFAQKFLEANSLDSGAPKRSHKSGGENGTSDFGRIRKI